MTDLNAWSGGWAHTHLMLGYHPNSSCVDILLSSLLLIQAILQLYK